MKQSFELLDTESGFKVSLETTNEVLSSDQLFKLPDVANATLATTKNIADMVSDLNTGVLEPRSAKLLDGKQPSDFALNDLSNVDLQGLNIGGNSPVMFNIAAFSVYTAGVLPTVGNNIPIFNSVGEFNTINPSQKIDSNTFLLKAGKTYKIEGGLNQVTAKAGFCTTLFKFFKASDNSVFNLDNSNGHFMGYVAGSTSFDFRDYKANGYITPTEDLYLRFQCTNNTLTSCTNYETEVVITEYMTNDIALATMKINGKSFDNNNNIDLEGLSTLSNYSTTETLTENRWIDGKPIYRKVFTGLTAVAQSTWAIAANIPNLSGVVGGYGSYTTQGVIPLIMNISGIGVNIYSPNTLLSAGWSLTVEYTKSTDTVSSPVRLVGSGNGTAGIVSELPALTGSEGKYLRVNPLSGLLEWKKKYFTTKTNSAAVNYNYNISTNMVIDSLTSGDTEASATGVNGGFVIPESGVYTISADYFHSSASHVNVAEIIINIFVNSVTQKRILRPQDLGGSNKGFDFSVDLKLNTGDVITFQTYIWATSATVSNNLVVPANGLHFTLASK